MNPKTINYMLGQSVNDWTILEVRPGGKKGLVLAKCVCGKVREVRGRSIRTGVSKNCGCKKGLKIRGRAKSPNKNGAQSAVYRRYARTAGYHSRLFNLTFEEFINIAKSDCHYCGCPPTNVSLRPPFKFLYNGVDRVNNELGYIPSNVVPCCTVCNTHKGSITLNIVHKITEFIKNGKS